MVDEKYFMSDKMIEYMLNDDCGTFWNAQARFNPKIARTLSCRTGGGCQRVSFENYIAYGFPEDCSADKIRSVFEKYMEDKKAYLNPDNIRIRKLTGKECYRLMGFTDMDYNAAAAVVSESRIYEQAGNSIVVPVLEAIFRQMI